MPELTLEALAARLASLEKDVAALKTTGARRPTRSWRRTVGMFDANPEFMRQVIAEGQAIREAERQAANEAPV
jgi:hypothetical protein